MTIPGAEASVGPLDAESTHSAREFLDALQEHGVVGRSANTRELRQRDGFHDAVCTASRAASNPISRLAGESGINAAW
jgi:hypothetical protein